MTLKTKIWMAAVCTVCVAALAFVGFKKFGGAGGNAANKTGQPTEWALRYQKVAKWAVAYDDLALGRVQGVAYCDWIKSPHCHLKFLDAAGQKFSLQSSSIAVNNGAVPSISLTLQGASPGLSPTERPEDPEQQVTAAEGSTITISLRQWSLESGETEQKTDETVVASAAADADFVDVDLEPLPDGRLVGGWSYFADPLTERNQSGGGRMGVFRYLQDSHLKQHGGFLGQQSGEEFWTPLLPRIYAVHVLEDQAAFDGQSAVYPHAGQSDVAEPRNRRTLVIIGRDLPIDGAHPVQDILANDSLRYRVLTAAGSDAITGPQKNQIEQAFRSLTANMAAAEAAEFRKLDAVLVEVVLTEDTDAGVKEFRWGTAKSSWALQYGDNTAEVRFVRILNEKESEITNEIVVPEKIVVEVEPRNFAGNDIPVMVGGAAAPGGHLDLVATRDATKRWLFRTPAFKASQGGKLMAAVDPAKTHFLRAGEAEATARLGSLIWYIALEQAGNCNNKKLNPDNAMFPAEEYDWRPFASRTAGSITLKGQTVEIKYGDHAAMILLRNAFLQLIASRISEVRDALFDDGLADAWYRSMHDLVTYAHDFPLADVQVSSPTGAVPFRTAYSEIYRQQTFHPDATPDGQERYLQWRRRATRQAMLAFREEMESSQAHVQQIEPCDRWQLLELINSGFKDIGAHLSPLLMKYHRDSGLMEPDWLARAYLKNLDQLAERLHSVQEFSAVVKHTAVVMVTCALGGPPALFFIASNAALGRQPEPCPLGLVGGLVQFGYESGYQIYETYQQHEEVRFAYGTVGTLNIERYFDAQSRATPWWKTGFSIFGGAVLQGLFSYHDLAGTSTEGMAAWRGSRVLARPDIDLATTRALPADTQRDVAAFLLNEERQLATTLIQDGRSIHPTQIFNELGGIAEGHPLPDLPTTLKEFELEQMVQEVPTTKKLDLSRSQADTLHSELAVAEESAADDIRQAATVPTKDSGIIEFRGEPESRLAQFEAEAKANPALAKLRAQVEAEFKKNKWKLYPDLPLPRRPTTIHGVPGPNDSVTLDLGEAKGQGGFMTVYELKTKPKGLKLIPALEEAEALGAKLEHQYAMQTAEPWVREMGWDYDTFGRLEEGQQVFRELGVEQLEFQVVSKEKGILLTKLARDVTEGGEYIISKTSKEKLFLGAERDAACRAVAVLYKAIFGGGVLWLDGYLPNIYFREAKNGELIAGSLDQDFAFRFDKNGDWKNKYNGLYGRFWTGHYETEPLEGEVRRFPRSFKVYTQLKTAEEYGARLLEANGFVGFDPNRKVYVPAKCDPSVINSVFKLLPFPFAE